MGASRWTLAALLALAAGLQACDRGGVESEPAREQVRPLSRSGDAASPTRDFAAREDAGRRASPEAEDSEDPRDQPQPVHDDGAPLWSATSRVGAAENAQEKYDRNGEAFGAETVDDYVDLAHAFIAKPPAGTQTLTRNNGDRLYYDPKANVFVVATRDGAPRTMFKPDDGAAYWEQQKRREARRGGDDREDRG